MHPTLASRHETGIESRRRILLLAVAGMAWTPAAWADLLSSLTPGDASSGVRAALERGARAAVDLLGRNDGFWGNERVRIPLPDWLQKGEGLIRMLGHGKDLDALHESVNRAAEQAVPQARELLVGAVRTMSVQDAKSILTGGDDSATKYFESRTREPLSGKFLPIVTGVTKKSGLAVRYDALAEKAQSLGLVKQDASIERHVTGKALDGLYLTIGDEERKIRTDPVATGSAILKKVFGSLQGR